MVIGLIPETEREALMRITMCARNQCSICKYGSIFTHKDCEMLITENMHVLMDALEVKKKQTRSLIDAMNDAAIEEWNRRHRD